jgi:hypothetical protein
MHETILEFETVGWMEDSWPTVNGHVPQVWFSWMRGGCSACFSRLDVQYSLDGSEAVFPSLSLLCWLAELQYVPHVYRL